ncbi:MAG: 50S ribosomal protein L30e [Candidatus Micrarchaeota archaeon]
MAKKKDTAEDTTEDIEEAKQLDEETEEEEVVETKSKKKKVVRRRKTKERENPLVSAIRLAVESGKVEFGARTGLFESMFGKTAKLFIVAANTPAAYNNNVAYFAKKASIPVIAFPGSTMELGSVCGKPFPVSVLSVYDVGNSNLMDFAK